MSLAQRRGMVDRERLLLSIARQCALLGVARSSLYYRPREASGENLALMQAMDRQYLGYTLLLVEAYEGLAGAGGQVREPEAGAAADAHHGAAGHLSQSLRQPACAGAPGLSLPVGEAQSYPAQPGVGRRHHLPAHGPGVPLPGGHHGLAQPVRGGLAIVQQPPIVVEGRLWRPTSASTP